MRARSRLFRLVMLVLAAFAVFNIAVARRSRRFPVRIKVAEIRDARGANVILIGNSLLDGRMDVGSFERTARAQGEELIPVNAALGASHPSDQYLLFREAMRSSQAKAVVIGFFDFQLTHEERTEVSDLWGNRALAFDPKIKAADARAIYHFSMPDQLKYATFRAFPALAHRGNAWGYVEKLRRKLAAVGMPPQGSNNEFGRVADFSALESTSVEAFDREAHAFAAQPTHLNEPAARMIEQAKARGVKVVLLLMPISPYHRSTFYSEAAWHDYLEALRTLATKQGVTFVDGSAWFPGENSFSDRLHLRMTEASPLGARIANVVSSQLLH